MRPTTGTEDLLRLHAPQVLGALVRRYGHFGAAEDAVQEALLAAPHGPAARRRGTAVRAREAYQSAARGTLSRPEAHCLQTRAARPAP